jgi:uncharacterized iron-regulated protein
LLAEIHTSTADHTWQLRTLEAVAVQRPALSLALEMVPSRLQPVLDRWSAGQLREDAFLEQVEWGRVWGHDPDLYLPLLRWARQRRVPLLALNAEPDLVKRVRSQGLAAIPPAQRDGIGTPAAPSAAYRQRLSDAWLGHGGEQSGEQSGGQSGAAPPWSASQLADLQRFIDSQLLRDRAMAEAIAAAHRRDPSRLVVALIGSGHLEGQDGVPLRLTLERAGRRLRLELRLPPRRDPRLAARGWPKGTMAGGVAIGDAPRPS